MNANAMERKLHRALHSARSYFENFCAEAEGGIPACGLRCLVFSEKELDLVINKAHELQSADHPNAHGIDPDEEVVRLSGHGLARENELRQVAKIFKQSSYFGIYSALAGKASDIKVHTKSLRVSIEGGGHDFAPHNGDSVHMPERFLTELALVSSLWNLSHDYFLATRLLRAQFLMRGRGQSILDNLGFTLVS